MKKIGLNFKKLMFLRMSNEAVPPGGGLNAALNFLSSKNSMMHGIREANEWTENAIRSIRMADEPNPWRDADDEEIAGEIVRRVEEKQRAQKL